MYPPRSIRLVIIASLFVIAESVNRAPPVVRTQFGWITGTWSTSARDLPIANFLGIPYAEPPVGALRFQNPVPWTRSWTGSRDASKDSPPCIQISVSGEISGEEDCLYLNVFVPKITDSKYITCKYPVLVFIRGGSFNTGVSDSQHYGPTYLADQMVILVTMNYRLGPLGFFSLGNEVAPGNYGLKDMLQALRWVRENIEQFGGNPNSVTLMGHSAGAGAAHLLALSNKTDGLFNKYILHSGSALGTWAVHTRSSIRESSLHIVRNIGCWTVIRDSEEDTENSTQLESLEFFEEESGKVFDEETMDCMRSFNASSILERVPDLYLWRQNPYCIFGPTLEDDTIEDAIVSIPPMEIIEKHLFRDMPCIIGVVRDEGLLKSLEAHIVDETRQLLIDNFTYFLPTFTENEEIIRNVTEYVEAILQFYFGRNVSYDSMDNITKMTGDVVITWPVYKAVKHLSKISNSGLYFYLFNYEGTFSRSFNPKTHKNIGITHGDDLYYLFPVWNNIFSDLSFHNTENDETMINIMTEMWANFMRTGVPSAWNTTQWPDYREHHKFMRFGAGRRLDIGVELDFLPDRMEFWETLMGNVTYETLQLDAMNWKKPDEEEAVSQAYTLRVPSLLVCFAMTVFTTIPKFDISNIIGL